MAKVVLIVVLALEWLGAKEGILAQKCAVCHRNDAPPLGRIYRRYLMLYSSKERIKKRMVDFLVSPSLQKSAMPLGMRKRFDPQAHPSFSSSIARQAVEELIEKEDILKHIVVDQ